MTSNSQVTTALSQKAFYAPYAKGVYEVSVGLRPLGTDYGNGDADGKVFQLDEEFHIYRENVEKVRGANLRKHYGFCEYDDALRGRVNETIVHRLVTEHPAYFQLHKNRLVCGLTGDVLLFDDTFQFVETDDNGYESGLDALASQVQEDLIVVGVEEGRNWLSAVHVCAPSHWDPSAKIGQDFRAIHRIVPRIEGLNNNPQPLMEVMARKGRHVRFVWGVTTSPRLNLHPLGTEHHNAGEPSPAPAFDPDEPRLFVRVERQTVVAVPGASAFLFTIRLYVTDCATLSRDDRLAIRDGLLSMSPESRAYKGVSQSFQEMVRWLEKEGSEIR